MSCPVGETSTPSSGCPVAHTSTVTTENASTTAGQNGPAEPIPQPPTHWFTGNLPDIDPSFLAGSYSKLAKIYGPIFKLDLPGRPGLIVLSSQKLIHEVCDDERFEKAVKAPLLHVRDSFLKDGLFTAYSDEPSWFIAHRILVPVFGPLSIRKMFGKMVDISSQMILKWDRESQANPNYEILCSDDFTRLAFDTIGLTVFNYRFNEFYSKDAHPFATQMADVLIECMKQSGRPVLEQYFHPFSQAKRDENARLCWQLCDEIVADRKQNPKPEVDDLLKHMLDDVDPKTGEKMSDENIRYNMATFLVAGHETTSGTLSFLFMNLLDNPEALYKCYDEVNEVIGDHALELSHLPKLKYIEASIRETLRYMGPISIFQRHAKNPTRLAGKYIINPDQVINCNLRGLHHDPEIWGEDANQFRPERMLDGGFERLPPDSWKPFGTGARACIGRALAEQEMLICAALIFQRFIVEKADPHYQFRIKSTLTIKPDGFKIKIRRRPGKSDMVGIPGAPIASTKQTRSNEAAEVQRKGDTTENRPMTAFFGGNTGTCKSFAEDLQTHAENFGLNSETKALDSAIEALPTDRPVAIITASYEGQPPDNAKSFVSWLETNQNNPSKLKGVKYSVLGVGNSEWYATFHRIPKLVDELMEKMGAERICPAGYVDVKEDIVGPFEDWKESLLPKFKESAGVKGTTKTQELNVSIDKPNIPQILAGQAVSEAYVLVNKRISGAGPGPQKMHMEIELPKGTTYQTGDYLVILPFNPKENVLRAMRHFGLLADGLVNVSGTKKAHLLVPATVYDFLSTRVELSTPASQRQLQLLASLATGEEAEKLKALGSDEKYKNDVLAKRFSVLDLLEDYRTCSLTFGQFLDLLPPLAPRQYSISSSPLMLPIDAANPDEAATLKASITYDVHEAPALSGSDRTFRGVATSYLSSLQPGSKLRCFTRPTQAAFHLPPNSEIPVIMFATGTGVAPMRGFIQERLAMQRGGGRTLGPAVFYFGCRDVDSDYLYREELEQAEREGAVKMRPVFSRNAPAGDKAGHLDERVWQERDEVAQMFLDGGKIFVCGSASGLGRSAGEVCKRIWMERSGGTDEQAEAWLQKVKEDRYVTDVFG